MDFTENFTKIEGEVEAITYRSDDSGWSVIKVRDKTGKLFTATGAFTFLKTGEYLAFQGHWTQHKTHGRQFKVEQAKPMYPTTSEGIIRYLSSGVIRGIGPVTAARIVDQFKENTLNIIDECPQRLSEVEHIGPKKAQSIVQAWQESRGYRDAELFLFSHQLSPTLTHKIIKAYGHKTIEVVSGDPYRLSSEIPGVGFLTADKIASSLGLSPESPQRLKAACLYLVHQAEDQGHCYLNSPQLMERLCNLLKLDDSVVKVEFPQIIETLNSMGSIISEEDGNEDAHYLQDVLTAEDRLSRKLVELLSHPVSTDRARIDAWLQKYSQRLPLPLSETQLQAVVDAVSHRVFILTGGPGVGKTTTANAIIRLLAAMRRSVALAAPTGRAAQRLTEVTGLQAKTVHRLLEWTPQENGFQRHQDNPLNAQVIVIDEASMLDIKLAHSLAEAVSSNAQIILIGDVDQLPSVGAGNVLRDLIESNKVPYCRLSEIFRQAASSLIVSTAHQINQGLNPEFPDIDGADCRFLAVDGPHNILETIKFLIQHTLTQNGHYDPVKDLQVLTPMNRGDLGTKVLNQELQALLNPEESSPEQLAGDSLSFRPGDKVIQISNNYELNVFNGDIGFVEHAGVEGSKMMVQFADRRVTYSKEDAYDLRLAYAITIHKSQGSEFPVVIIPLSMQHYIMLQRNLIYTALTRAKKFAIFVGSQKALEQAIQTQTSRSRQTKLVERLSDYLIQKV